jgi:hypothetical protein
MGAAHGEHGMELGLMTMNNGEVAFRRWLNAGDLAIDIDIECLMQNEEALEWYREIFRQYGPIPAARLRKLIEQTRESVLPSALAIFLQEIRRKRGEELSFIIEKAQRNRFDSRNGFYLIGRELYSLTIQDGVAEIGEIIQDELIDRDQEVWPVCPEHTVGLHPSVVDGRAVWWCMPGNHSLGIIGDASNAFK